MSLALITVAAAMFRVGRTKVDLTWLKRTSQSWLISRLLSAPGALTDFAVDDFVDKLHPLLGGRCAATFLHLSRIALATGQREKAIAFAEWGIQLCSEGATGMIAKLEAVMADAID